MINRVVNRFRRFLPRSKAVGRAQINLLLHHTKFQIYAAPVVGLFLVLAFADNSKTVEAWTWLVALVLAYGVRILFIAILRLRQRKDPKHQFTTYLIGLAIAGLLWSLAPHALAVPGTDGQLVIGIFVGIVVLIGLIGNFLHYGAALVYTLTWVCPSLVSFGLVYVDVLPGIGWTYAGVAILFLLYAWKCLEVVNLPLGRSMAQNEALEREKERAIDSERAKSDFLAMMSHELRTPLNAIMGYSEIIRDRVFGTKADGKYPEQASYIHDAASLLRDLIDDLLELSELQAKGRELTVEPVSPENLVGLAVKLLQEEAAKRNIRMETRLQSNLPEVSADRRAAIQCVTNIVGNAIKYSPDGSIIAIHSETSGDYVRIRVQDNGPGIPIDDLPAVTEPFRRGANAIDSSAQGVGLGLSIADTLMRGQSGYLDITSEPGQGTLVTLSFPVLSESSRQAEITNTVA